MRFYDPQSKDDGWTPLESAAKLNPASCEAVGYIIGVTKHKLVLAMAHSEDECIMKFTLPLGCVISIHSIQVGEQRRLQ